MLAIAEPNPAQTSRPQDFTVANAVANARVSAQTKTAESKRERIKQAVLLAQSIVEAAKEMREQVSQPAPDGETAAQAEARRVEKRAAAGVLSRLVIAWGSNADAIRNLKGEPTPGQKRPVPDELKVPKARKSNLPPDEV